MGRIESLESIAFDIECIGMFTQFKNKYKYSKLGFLAKDIVEQLKKEMLKKIKKHKKEFNDVIDISIFEEIL